MAGVIDMRRMRYINLFSRISSVRTTNCFEYNNQIVFAVPKKLVSKAIGRSARNIRKIKEILGKRVKIIVMPSVSDRSGIVKFVEDLVSPIELSRIEIKGDSLLITAGRQSKAAIIGRNRIREKELFEIIKNSFRILDLRIL